MIYVVIAMIVAVMIRERGLKRVLLMLQTDLNQSQWGVEVSMGRSSITMQNDRGRKKMLPYVNSLTFSPSCVEARLSMMELALKSCSAVAS